EALAAGRVPVFAGGDHALSAGSVNAVSRAARAAGRPMAVLWLDAHSDFNTPATSPSGNIHGMPVAALCGEPGLDFLYAGCERSPLEPASFHMFGIRSVDAEERRALRARGVDVTDMRQIDEQGTARAMAAVLDRVAAAGAMLHVSLDVDFLDPAIAPGVGTTVDGGATYREAHLVMEMLADSGLVGSLDLVELNPYLDHAGQTARLMTGLVASLFGRSIMERRTGGDS
ncbi:MAG TPA: arginase, partial [Thermohalobaculum sp.]|nr:arginase [Thermohalobaculum sp.]